MTVPADLDVGGGTAAREELDGRLEELDILDGPGDQLRPLRASRSRVPGLRRKVITQWAMVLTVES